MRLPEADRRDRVARFMARVTATTPALFNSASATSSWTSRSTPSSMELSSAAVAVLVKSALEPGTFLTDLYQDLGLLPGQGKSAVDELRAQAMAMLHRLARKGRGGQPQVLETLPAGIEELRKRGITPAARVLARGGFKHDIYGRWIERWERHAGARQVWFEWLFGHKAFDLGIESRDGKLSGVEIICSGSPAWNSNQMVKAASVQGIAEVIVACEDVKLLKALSVKLREVDQLGLYEKKLRLRLVSDFMPDGGGSGIGVGGNDNTTSGTECVHADESDTESGAPVIGRLSPPATNLDERTFMDSDW